MQSHEVNFDGLVGPTHNYAGLSHGNVASMSHGGAASNPREAALQGLAKMKFLADLGLRQAVLPPHERPSIEMLRALGFGALPVLLSVLGESLVLALVGGALGGALAYIGFNGYQTSTMNWQSFSQVAFAFAVTPALLIQGLSYALVMGLLGGFFPAVRAARLPISKALREL